MRKHLVFLVSVTVFISFSLLSHAQYSSGDTLSIDGRKFKLLSSNLISNAGFESNFFGWTDATTTAATLTATKFSISASGGVNNSKYLIGLTNENSSSSGSIGTGWPIASGKTYILAYQVKYLNAATAAGSEAYLKISCTNDKTSSSEPKVLISSTKVNGNSAWTRNFVYFTNSNPSYSYVQVRFRWLGNRLGFDDFVLCEAVEIASVELLQNKISQAQALLTQYIQNSIITSLNTAIAQAQTTISAQPVLESEIISAITNIDLVLNAANASLSAFKKLKKAIDDANLIVTFLEKSTEISTLQQAIVTANTSYVNRDLDVTEINNATATLLSVTRSVGKQIYNPSWMLGDIYSSTNNWSLDRSKQSKNWILFWEPGFGDNPGTIVDECLALAEKSFQMYADSLKFITRGKSKTDTYKMIIRLRYSSDWEASGSGVDNTIGLLTLTSWALTSRGGQTIAHEVGHCFQYQVHCDNNNNNGWMYGFGTNASGGNGWWEQCAQWQAYKVFPSMQFSNEWFNGYLSRTHKHPLHETPRYENFFIQDYWTSLHGMDFIGKLWNQSYNPEDPIETYKRITSNTQTSFNDQMWTCAARFATWDIPALKSYGASYITSRTQPKLNNTGNYVWRIDSTACPENYGHNIIRLNAPTTAKTLSVNFEGLAGSNGFRKNYTLFAGWRYGLVALLKDGSRIYSEIKPASMTDNAGKSTLQFSCPANCDKLWLVVSGAPTLHWRHAWDDNDANDEQWPYQVSFNNTNIFGYINVTTYLGDDTMANNYAIYSNNKSVCMANLPLNGTLKIQDITGKCVYTDRINSSSATIALPSGAYIINIQTASNCYHQKVYVK